ncbi:VOC family protein [Microscilla marina]|uniref:Glyoxalase family protein n=1 Tax=Microscilla marina ATCC 23134 TaxID=313606 RepID=A2A0B3_MICM2|nr:VOC family protein [Microscilla marina]EAY23929.1 glyoxalase family protein [Microscilla marina ATCC 23134]
MQIKTLTPNLMVNNVAETIMYYNSILGFELVQTVPETPPYDWAMVSTDGLALMFQSVDSMKTEFKPLEQQATGGGLSFYLRVEGVEDLYEKLKGKVTVVNDLKESFYGMTEFSIQDLNGFVLTFAENLNPSVATESSKETEQN